MEIFDQDAHYQPIMVVLLNLAHVKPDILNQICIECLLTQKL